MIELADVNVLVALLWERHVDHVDAVDWFERLDDSFATTTVTQLGFVRVSSHPRILGEQLTVGEATATLRALCAHRRHVFLADGRGFIGNELVPIERLTGHRPVTDAHLVAVARAHSARLVTFDRGLARIGGDEVVVLGRST